MKTKNYSVKCWLGADMCQVYFKYMTNAKKAYETISATMEYDRVQLIKLENGEETNLSTTTKEEEQ